VELADVIFIELAREAELASVLHQQ